MMERSKSKTGIDSCERSSFQSRTRHIVARKSQTTHVKSIAANLGGQWQTAEAVGVTPANLGTQSGLLLPHLVPHNSVFSLPMLGDPGTWNRGNAGGIVIWSSDDHHLNCGDIASLGFPAIRQIIVTICCNGPRSWAIWRGGYARPFIPDRGLYSRVAMAC
jgi:hypothetical protein